MATKKQTSKVKAAEQIVEEVTKVEEVQEVVSSEISEVQDLDIPVTTETKIEDDVIYGKGDYAITPKNIARLTKAVKAYNESGIWCWALYDSLGLAKNGKFSNKYKDIYTSLLSDSRPEVQELGKLMSETPQRAESEITSQTRLTPEQKAEIEQAKAARRLEVTDILSKVKGLSEEEVSRMVRAI